MAEAAYCEPSLFHIAKPGVSPGLLPPCILKYGGQSDRLPTKHTCFHELLPEYTRKELLADQMALSLDNTHGCWLNESLPSLAVGLR